jgi:hypothetical protein
MKWFVVALIAEILAALALVAAVSYMTSTETCRATEDSGLTNRPGETRTGPVTITHSTCSRRFWWQ